MAEGTFAEGSPIVEKSQKERFLEAAKLGQSVVGVAVDRVSRRLSNPMVDPEKLPTEAKVAVKLREEPTEEDILDAQKASITLVVDAAAQTCESRPRSSQVNERTESLRDLGGILHKGATLITETEKTNPDIVIEAGRAAIKQRDPVAASQWDNTRVLRWVHESLQRSYGRVNSSLRAIDAYFS